MVENSNTDTRINSISYLQILEWAFPVPIRVTDSSNLPFYSWNSLYIHIRRKSDYISYHTYTTRRSMNHTQYVHNRLQLGNDDWPGTWSALPETVGWCNMRHCACSTIGVILLFNSLEHIEFLYEIELNIYSIWDYKMLILLNTP